MSTSQTLLERDEELDLLSNVLEGVGSAGGRVVLIRGEAGIGKTALVREFVARHGDEISFLLGACDDLTTPEPLGPFWDIAREEHTLMEPLRESDRPVLLTAILDLLQRMLRPTILVIEDTQWADEATLDAIKYLGRRIDQTHGLLLLTYRDTEVDHDHPLRAVIGELSPSNVVRVNLQPLSLRAVASLVDQKPLDPEEIWALTDGNPLFVTELAAAETETVPGSIQDAVFARATKLSPEAREALEVISVIPTEAEHEILELLGLTTEQLTECERQGLIHLSPRTATFKHELTRRAILSALDPERRRQLNATILKELESHPGPVDPARLVHHSREADDVAGIIAHAPVAARAARAVDAHQEAVAHYNALEPHLDSVPPSDRAAIYEDWARSEGDYLDNYPRARDLLAKAIDLYTAIGDDTANVRALLYAVRVTFWARVDPGEPERCMDRALTILEASASTRDLAYATSQQAYLAMLRGDDQKASERADRALKLAEEAGDESVLIQALNTKGVVTWRRDYKSGSRLLEEAMNRARAAGNSFEHFRAMSNLTDSALRRRDLKVAERLAETLQEIAARHELPGLENATHTLKAELLRRRGQWDRAEDVVTETLATRPRGPFLADLHLELGILETRRGRPRARTNLDKVWSELSGPRDTVLYAGALAENMWLTGEVDRALLTRFHDLLERGIGEVNLWEAGELALWMWKLGELSEMPEEIPDPYRLIMEGEPLAAAQMWDELGHPYEQAIALLHGDTDAQLAALEILDTLGATAVAAKLRQELRQQGVSVPRGRAKATKQHPVGLTPRQAEVLGLLAEGLSNIEIADRLFLSPRTVEHHVSAVLSKVNASTREEAVSAAADQGLLASR